MDASVAGAGGAGQGAAGQGGSDQGASAPLIFEGTCELEISDATERLNGSVLSPADTAFEISATHDGAGWSGTLQGLQGTVATFSP